jgi:hypothetical protein
MGLKFNGLLQVKIKLIKKTHRIKIIKIFQRGGGV